MSQPKSLPDLLVVGGGVIGLSIAWRAATSGCKVTLVDPGPAAPSEQAASFFAAGMLAPVTEVHFGEEALLDLNLASCARWPAFAAELETATGVSTGYRICGTLVVARDSDDHAALMRLHEYQLKLGLEVTRLRGSAARRLEPALSPRVRSALLVAGDHQVDNRRLLRALRMGCVRAGVIFCCARVTRLAPPRVQLETGEWLGADTVVLAAGAWSGREDGLAAGLDFQGLHEPDVHPVKGQILRLRDTGTRPLLTRVVRGFDVYLVPREKGEIVVGATMEEQGFDTTVTGGAVHDMLRDAQELVPGIMEAELVECGAGLRPVHRDNAPVIGSPRSEEHHGSPRSEEHHGSPDLLFATGHGRNGVLLAPITADVVLELLHGASLPVLARAFQPGFQPCVQVGGDGNAGSTGPENEKRPERPQRPAGEGNIR